jgi:regulator of replication initiation timing
MASAKDDPTLQPSPLDEPVIRKDTFGSHKLIERNENGTLAVTVELRARGILRRSHTNQIVPLPWDVFSAALAAFLLKYGIVLDLGNDSARDTARKRYTAVAKAASKKLITPKLRADKNPTGRRTLLDSLSTLYLPVECCKWVPVHPEEVIRKERDELRECVGELKSELRETTEENDILREENESLRTRLELLEQSERAHAREMQTLREEINTLSGACAERDQRIAELEASLREAVDKIDRLEGEIRTQTESARRSLETVLKLSERKEDCAKLVGENHLLRSKLDARAEKQREQAKEIRDLRAKADALGVENRNLRGVGVVRVLEMREKRRSEEEKKAWETAGETLDDEQYFKLVQRYLYVKEKFHISDAAFYELYMIYQDFNSFPSAYDVMDTRAKMYKEYREDKGLNLRPTPNGKGHQVSIKEVWRRELIAALDRGEITLKDVAKFRLGVCDSVPLHACTRTLSA